jgi:hypothetical protein
MKACIAREKDNYVSVIETWLNIKDKRCIAEFTGIVF